jgi:hypothetical protein
MKYLWLLGILTGLMACNDFTIADSADHYGTGTLNEPGTAVNPQQGVDLYEEINGEMIEKATIEVLEDTLDEDS